MQTDDNSVPSGFFNDIRTILVGLLVGLGSMYTVVPAFMNHLEEYFGINGVDNQIWVFKLVYFVLPALLLGALLYKGWPAMSKYRRWIKTGLAIAGIIFIFFISILFYFFEQPDRVRGLFATFSISLTVCLWGCLPPVDG